MSQSGGGQPPGPGAPPFGGTQLMPMVDPAPSDFERAVPGYGMPPPQDPPIAPAAPPWQAPQPQYAQPPQPQYAQPRPPAVLPPGYAGGPQLQQAVLPQQPLPQQPLPQQVPRPGHDEEVPEQGFWIERLRGLKMLGAGAALLALNVGSLIFLEQYYIITTVIMLPLFFGGGWQVVFGDEFDDRTHQLVLWKRIGFYGCIGFGLLCGIGLLVLLNL
ncbi:MAG: hypothetical protein R3B89_30640 [Polyangiaceae bacterium]